MSADRFANDFTDNGRVSAFAAFTAQPFFRIDESRRSRHFEPTRVATREVSQPRLG